MIDCILILYISNVLQHACIWAIHTCFEIRSSNMYQLDKDYRGKYALMKIIDDYSEVQVMNACSSRYDLRISLPCALSI